MYVADMHCDSLLAVSAERGLVGEHNFSKKNPHLQFVATFVPARGADPKDRRAKLIRYLDTYLYETARNNLTRVEGVLDLNRAVDYKLSAALLSIEGGGGLFADSEELRTLYRGGLRVLGMAWDSNELATGAWDEDDRGLTEEGKRLAKTCVDMGIVLDVSHLSDRSFDELYETVGAPLLATHSNFRDVCASRRNLTKEQARKIVARGGVIGLNLCEEFLTDEKRKATAEDILRHVDYALENFGDGAFAFGGDIDGIESYPEGFGTDASIHDKLVELLLSHYSAETVERIAGRNVIDFLKENLG